MSMRAHRRKPNGHRPGVVSEPDLLEALARPPWRGDVPELKNINQHLALIHGGETRTGAAPGAAEPDHACGLPPGPMPAGGLSLVELKKEVMRRALVPCNGNRSRTAPEYPPPWVVVPPEQI